MPLLLPPTPSVSLSCRPYGTWPEPVNMTCSNRWAKPVRPGASFLDPTWYQTFTATVGVERSCDKITVSPFGRTYCSKGMLIEEDCCAAAVDTSTAQAKTATRRLIISTEHPFRGTLEVDYTGTPTAPGRDAAALAPAPSGAPDARRAWYRRICLPVGARHEIAGSR